MGELQKSYGFEIKPEIEIRAHPSTIWAFLIDVEKWWVHSNPEHDSLKIIDQSGKLKEGTKISIKEKIAGIPCRAHGEITNFKERELLEWKAVYHIFGLKFLKVFAGVKWKLRNAGDGKSALMANVWAEFPRNIRSGITWYLFKHLFNGIEKDREHAMKELQYIKYEIEMSST